MGLWVYYHYNSILRASILTKLGTVGRYIIYSDHFQLNKFWPPRAPGKGVAAGEKFRLRLTAASAQCLRPSERFFIDFFRSLPLRESVLAWVEPIAQTTQSFVSSVTYVLLMAPAYDKDQLISSADAETHA